MSDDPTPFDDFDCEPDAEPAEKALMAILRAACNCRDYQDPDARSSLSQAVIMHIHGLGIKDLRGIVAATATAVATANAMRVEAKQDLEFAESSLDEAIEMADEYARKVRKLKAKLRKAKSRKTKEGRRRRMYEGIA